MLDRIVELGPIAIFNIYIIIGIIVTLLTYEKISIGMAKDIEENAFIFAGLTVNQIDTIVRYMPLLVIFVWPLSFIGIITGFVQGIIKVINK